MAQAKAAFDIPEESGEEFTMERFDDINSILNQSEVSLKESIEILEEAGDQKPEKVSITDIVPYDAKLVRKIFGPKQVSAAAAAPDPGKAMVFSLPGRTRNAKNPISREVIYSMRGMIARSIARQRFINRLEAIQLNIVITKITRGLALISGGTVMMYCTVYIGGPMLINYVFQSGIIANPVFQNAFMAAFETVFKVHPEDMVTIRAAFGKLTSIGPEALKTYFTTLIQSQSAGNPNYVFDFLTFTAAQGAGESPQIQEAILDIKKVLIRGFIDWERIGKIGVDVNKIPELFQATSLFDFGEKFGKLLPLVQTIRNELSKLQMVVDTCKFLIDFVSKEEATYFYNKMFKSPGDVLFNSRYLKRTLQEFVYDQVSERDSSGRRIFCGFEIPFADGITAFGTTLLTAEQLDQQISAILAESTFRLGSYTNSVLVDTVIGKSLIDPSASGSGAPGDDDEKMKEARLKRIEELKAEGVELNKIADILNEELNPSLNSESEPAPDQLVQGLFFEFKKFMKNMYKTLKPSTTAGPFGLSVVGMIGLGFLANLATNPADVLTPRTQLGNFFFMIDPLFQYLRDCINTYYVSPFMTNEGPIIVNYIHELIQNLLVRVRTTFFFSIKWAGMKVGEQIGITKGIIYDTAITIFRIFEMLSLNFWESIVTTNLQIGKTAWMTAIMDPSEYIKAFTFTNIYKQLNVWNRWRKDIFGSNAVNVGAMMDAANDLIGKCLFNAVTPAISLLKIIDPSCGKSIEAGIRKAATIYSTVYRLWNGIIGSELDPDCYKIKSMIFRGNNGDMKISGPLLEEMTGEFNSRQALLQLFLVAERVGKSVHELLYNPALEGEVIDVLKNFGFGYKLSNDLCHKLAMGSYRSAYKGAPWGLKETAGTVAYNARFAVCSVGGILQLGDSFESLRSTFQNLYGFSGATAKRSRFLQYIQSELKRKGITKTDEEILVDCKIVNDGDIATTNQELAHFLISNGIATPTPATPPPTPPIPDFPYIGLVINGDIEKHDKRLWIIIRALRAELKKDPQTANNTYTDDLIKTMFGLSGSSYPFTTNAKDSLDPTKNTKLDPYKVLISGLLATEVQQDVIAEGKEDVFLRDLYDKKRKGLIKYLVDQGELEATVITKYGLGQLPLATNPIPWNNVNPKKNTAISSVFGQRILDDMESFIDEYLNVEFGKDPLNNHYIHKRNGLIQGLKILSSALIIKRKFNSKRQKLIDDIKAKYRSKTPPIEKTDEEIANLYHISEGGNPIKKSHWNSLDLSKNAKFKIQWDKDFSPEEFEQFRNDHLILPEDKTSTAAETDDAFLTLYNIPKPGAPMDWDRVNPFKNDALKAQLESEWMDIIDIDELLSMLEQSQQKYANEHDAEDVFRGFADELYRSQPGGAVRPPKKQKMYKFAELNMTGVPDTIYISVNIGGDNKIEVDLNAIDNIQLPSQNPADKMLVDLFGKDGPLRTIAEDMARFGHKMYIFDPAASDEAEGEYLALGTSVTTNAGINYLKIWNNIRTEFFQGDITLFSRYDPGDIQDAQAEFEGAFERMFAQHLLSNFNYVNLETYEPAEEFTEEEIESALNFFQLDKNISKDKQKQAVVYYREKKRLLWLMKENNFLHLYNFFKSLPPMFEFIEIPDEESEFDVSFLEPDATKQKHVTDLLKNIKFPRLKYKKYIEELILLGKLKEAQDVLHRLNFFYGPDGRREEIIKAYKSFIAGVGKAKANGTPINTLPELMAYLAESLKDDDKFQIYEILINKVDIRLISFLLDNPMISGSAYTSTKYSFADYDSELEYLEHELGNPVPDLNDINNAHHKTCDFYKDGFHKKRPGGLTSRAADMFFRGTSATELQEKIDLLCASLLKTPTENSVKLMRQEVGEALRNYIKEEKRKIKAGLWANQNSSAENLLPYELLQAEYQKCMTANNLRCNLEANWEEKLAEHGIILEKPYRFDLNRALRIFQSFLDNEREGERIKLWRRTDEEEPELHDLGGRSGPSSPGSRPPPRQPQQSAPRAGASGPRAAQGQEQQQQQGQAQSQAQAEQLSQSQAEELASTLDTDLATGVTESETNSLMQQLMSALTQMLSYLQSFFVGNTGGARSAGGSGPRRVPDPATGQREGHDTPDPHERDIDIAAKCAAHKENIRIYGDKAYWVGTEPKPNDFSIDACVIRGAVSTVISLGLNYVLPVFFYAATACLVAKVILAVIPIAGFAGLSWVITFVGGIVAATAGEMKKSFQLELQRVSREVLKWKAMVPTCGGPPFNAEKFFKQAAFATQEEKENAEADFALIIMYLKASDFFTQIGLPSEIISLKRILFKPMGSKPSLFEEYNYGNLKMTSENQAEMAVGAPEAMTYAQTQQQLLATATSNIGLPASFYPMDLLRWAYNILGGNPIINPISTYQTTLNVVSGPLRAMFSKYLSQLFLGPLTTTNKILYGESGDATDSQNPFNVMIGIVNQNGALTTDVALKASAQSYHDRIGSRFSKLVFESFLKRLTEAACGLMPICLYFCPCSTQDAFDLSVKIDNKSYSSTNRVIFGSGTHKYRDFLIFLGNSDFIPGSNCGATPPPPPAPGAPPGQQQPPGTPPGTPPGQQPPGPQPPAGGGGGAGAPPATPGTPAGGGAPAPPPAPASPITIPNNQILPPNCFLAGNRVGDYDLYVGNKLVDINDDIDARDRNFIKLGQFEMRLRQVPPPQFVDDTQPEIIFTPSPNFIIERSSGVYDNKNATAFRIPNLEILFGDQFVKVLPVIENLGNWVQNIFSSTAKITLSSTDHILNRKLQTMWLSDHIVKYMRDDIIIDTNRFPVMLQDLKVNSLEPNEKARIHELYEPVTEGFKSYKKVWVLKEDLKRARILNREKDFINTLDLCVEGKKKGHFNSEHRFFLSLVMSSAASHPNLKDGHPNKIILDIESEEINFEHVYDELMSEHVKLPKDIDEDNKTWFKYGGMRGVNPTFVAPKKLNMECKALPQAPTTAERCAHSVCLEANTGTKFKIYLPKIHDINANYQALGLLMDRSIKYFHNKFRYDEAIKQYEAKKAEYVETQLEICTRNAEFTQRRHDALIDPVADDAFNNLVADVKQLLADDMTNLGVHELDENLDSLKLKIDLAKNDTDINYYRICGEIYRKILDHDQLYQQYGDERKGLHRATQKRELVFRENYHIKREALIMKIQNLRIQTGRPSMSDAKIIEDYNLSEYQSLDPYENTALKQKFISDGLIPINPQLMKAEIDSINTYVTQQGVNLNRDEYVDNIKDEVSCEVKALEKFLLYLQNVKELMEKEPIPLVETQDALNHLEEMIRKTERLLRKKRTVIENIINYVANPEPQKSNVFTEIMKQLSVIPFTATSSTSTTSSTGSANSVEDAKSISQLEREFEEQRNDPTMVDFFVKKFRTLRTNIREQQGRLSVMLGDIQVDFDKAVDDYDNLVTPSPE